MSQAAFMSLGSRSLRIVAALGTRQTSLPTCTILPFRDPAWPSVLRASAAARGSATFAVFLQECSLGLQMREAKCRNCSKLCADFAF